MHKITKEGLTACLIVIISGAMIVGCIFKGLLLFAPIIGVIILILHLKKKV